MLFLNLSALKKLIAIYQYKLKKKKEKRICSNTRSSTLIVEEEMHFWSKR